MIPHGNVVAALRENGARDGATGIFEDLVLDTCSMKSALQPHKSILAHDLRGCSIYLHFGGA